MENGIQRNKAVDGYRGLISLIIALFHFELFVSFGTSSIFATGYLGVEFFFVLSGFLLAKGIMNTNEFSVKRIMEKKILRLYPSYIISIILMPLLYSFLWYNGNVFRWLKEDSVHVKGLLSEIFCVQALGISGFNYINGPAWYVSALLISSFIILILKKCLNGVYKYFAPIGGGMLYIWLFWGNTYMDPTSYIYWKIPTSIIRALAGMLLGTFLYSVVMSLKKKIKTMHIFVISIMEIVATVGLFRMLLFRNASHLNYLIFLPISVLIVVMFSTDKGIVSKILSTKPFEFLGKISYTFYLLQSICSNFVLAVFSDCSPWKKIVIYLFVNFILAYALYLFAEVFIHKMFSENKVLESNYLIQYRLKMKINKKKLFCGIITILFSVLFVGLLIFQKNSSGEGDMIRVVAMQQCDEAAEGDEVWITGVSVDGTLYSATSIFEDGWLVDGTSIGWDWECDSTIIQGEIPFGKDRKVVLEQNKWRGIVQIEYDNQAFEINGYKDTEDTETIEVSLPDHMQEISRYDVVKQIVPLFLMIIIVIAMVIVSMKCGEEKKYNTKREIWADILRVFAMFTVVLLHCSNKSYELLPIDSTNWYGSLYLNSFTAFAVPVFFMLSGTFVIRDIENPVKVMVRRVKKAIIALIAWSMVYILYDAYISGELQWKRFLKIPFESQAPHLWFVYTLIGVYLLSPILSWLYYKLNQKQFCFLMLIIGFIPLFCKTFEAWTGYGVNISNSFAGFPEAFLFLLGKYIYDNYEKIKNRWYFWIGMSVIGYALVVSFSYYKSLEAGYAVKTWFSNYGTLPMWMFYTGIFMLFVSLKEKIKEKCSKRIKGTIAFFADISMGVYYVHILIKNMIDSKQIGSYVINTDSATAVDIIVSMILVSIISSIVVCILKKICIYKNMV